MLDNEDNDAPQQEPNTTAPLMQLQTDNDKLTSQATDFQLSWLDTNQVRELLKVSSVTLFRWRVKRMLPYSQVGRKIYYKQEDLNTFLLRHYYKPYKNLNNGEHDNQSNG